jgi:hypothetical protein
MDADPVKPLPAFGFLTVLDSAEHGLFGGYLVLSPLGRPLEFRCSTPIAPSRAQQILYGPTLRPYLLAEVIGQALVAGSEMPVRVILTDQRDMLPLGFIRSECIVHVERVVDAVAAPLLDAPASCECAGSRIALAELAPVALDQVRAWLEPLAGNVDLCEPFGRIIAALTEAQMAPHDAADAPDDHATAA